MPSSPSTWYVYSQTHISHHAADPDFSQTSWGSRADGDLHDKDRLRKTQRSMSMSTPKEKTELVRYITQRRMTLPSRYEKPVMHD